MDDFKRKIGGYRGHGKTCPCCREVPSKAVSRRLARTRLSREPPEVLEDEGEEDACPICRGPDPWNVCQCFRGYAPDQLTTGDQP